MFDADKIGRVSRVEAGGVRECGCRDKEIHHARGNPKRFRQSFGCDHHRTNSTQGDRRGPQSCSAMLGGNGDVRAMASETTPEALLVNEVIKRLRAAHPDIGVAVANTGENRSRGGCNVTHHPVRDLATGSTSLSPPDRYVTRQRIRRRPNQRSSRTRPCRPHSGYSCYMSVATSSLSSTVGVRELKNQLSSFLDRVKAGEEITVTEHGRPIARLSAVDGDVDRMADLVAAGIVQPATKPERRLPARKAKIVDGSSSRLADLVADQRG